MSLTEDKLTGREIEVYKYLLKGLDYYTIADYLGVKRSTIASHILNIFTKKLANSRQELMARRIEELEEEVEDLKRSKCITRV